MSLPLSNKSCHSCAEWGILVLRITVAAILMYNGYPKLFGNTAAELAFFESTVLPMPSILMLVAGVMELVGGLLLLLGLKTRILAWYFVFQFAVIILFVQLKHGFLAMQLDLAVLAMVYALSSIGGGAYSLDAYQEKKKANDVNNNTSV